MKRHLAHSFRATLLLLSLAASNLHAFESVAGDPILNRFGIDVGTFFYGSGTTVTLNGSSGQRGVPIDLEHQLGFTQATRFRFDGYWRITRHQRLRVAYFDASRHRSKTIDADLHFGNTTYPVGATVSAENSISVAELAYEYDFFTRDNFLLGANLGIHNIKFGLALAANTRTSSSTSTVSLYQKASADGPMPLVGLAAIWRLTPQFYATLEAQFLKITVNPYSGTLQDFAATAVWQATRHFGVGAGYDFFRIVADVNSPQFNGSLAWRYHGPRVFVSGSF